MKNTTIPLIGVLILALAGCAGSFSKVSDTMNQTPEWYEARKAEIGGDGYPDLMDVPVIQEGQEPGQSLPLSMQRVDELLARFASSPRAAPADMTPAQIEAIAQAVRVEFASSTPASEHLTEEDAEAIRQSFNVPRVTKGMKTQW